MENKERIFQTFFLLPLLLIIIFGRRNRTLQLYVVTATNLVFEVQI